MKDLNASEIATVAGGHAGVTALVLGAAALVAITALTSNNRGCNWQKVQVPGKTFVEDPHFENGVFVKGYEVEFHTEEWQCI